MQRALRTGLFACFAVGVWAAPQRPFTVVAFGDSTTAERGELPIYPRLLEEALAKGGPARVINAGVRGETTAAARLRWNDVLAAKPEVVVIQFGINDAAVDVWRSPPAAGPRVALEDYGRNLRGFVGDAKARGATVILMTPNPLCWTPRLRALYGKPPYRADLDTGLNPILREYVEVVRRVAKEEGCELVDVFARFLAEASGGCPSELLLDGMHPNAAGHRLIADELVRVLASR